MNDVRTVRFFAAQDAEDLYRCIENGRVYIRQQCDEDHVRWLTSVKWQGGYEADCPIREGLVMKIVDKSGNELYRENIIKNPGYMDTVAPKIAPFSGEAINNLSKMVESKYNLVSYDEWKKWLLEEAKEYGFTGYRDNWLYDNEYSYHQKIDKLDVLGERLCLVKYTAMHRKCGKVFTAYEIRTLDLHACFAICGYMLDKEA